MAKRQTKARKRRSLPLDVKKLVLHESGYRCAVPSCRFPITLDLHHIEYVSEDGPNTPDNLLPLCRNCHGLQHEGHIPKESIRAWKMLLLSLNEGYDRKSLDLLLALEKLDGLSMSGEGVVAAAGLIVSNLLQVSVAWNFTTANYTIRLSDRGRLFVEAWRKGDQETALTALPDHSKD
jgi:hypothetical protein